MKERSASKLDYIDEIVADNYNNDLSFEDSLIEMEWMLAADIISVHDIYNYGTVSHGTAPIPNNHEQMNRSFQFEIWMRQISTGLYEKYQQGLEVTDYWKEMDKEYKKQSKFSVKDIYYLGVLHAKRSSHLKKSNGHNNHPER